MRWPSSIETTATPIERGGPRSVWRERPTATIERRFRYGAYGSQSKLADQRPSPERPTLCPQIPLYSFVIAVEDRRPGCQTNDTAAGGQLYDYRRSCCWGRDTLFGGSSGCTSRAAKSSRTASSVVLGPQCDRATRRYCGSMRDQFGLPAAGSILSDRTRRSRASGLPSLPLARP